MISTNQANTHSESQLENFWHQQASSLQWFKKWQKVLDWQAPFAHWFVGGQLNASYLCVDVHAQGARRDKVALQWEDEQGNRVAWSYYRLYEEVNKFAYVFEQKGVKKGDIVIVYLPMMPETFAMILALTRLGATHSVVFSGFSSQALQDRINDTQAKFIVTADYGVRRGKRLDLKKIVDDALVNTPAVHNVFIYCRDKGYRATSSKDIVLNHLLPQKAVYVQPVAVESNHPLFILYTSGTTGKPKGIVHSTGGYLTYVHATMQWAFDLHGHSVYWCTADVGWITGHSYVLYGPLLHGLTNVIYEGAPDFPNPGKWWELIERYGVNILYTSPTALRMFMRLGDEWPAHYNLGSLQILGSVGEVINPEVWEWYHRVIGYKKCTVVDTWWQTETGGFMIAPAPALGKRLLKPGSATLPLPGIEAEVVDSNGTVVPRETKGFLVIKKPWPGMSLGIHGDNERFISTYWSKFPGAYYTGDYAIRDADGYFWLLGRADEVLNIAGHRIGTAEIESAAITHDAIAEAAAIGILDPVKGESVVIFAIVKQGVQPHVDLKAEVIKAVRNAIGAFVTPRTVHFVASLPKTRSGKIMRRLLKAVVENKAIGDMSTLEDEASLDEAKKMYQQIQESLQGMTD